MKKNIYLIGILLGLILTGCDKDSEFLDRPSNSILTTEQVFSDEGMTLSALADLYNQYLDFGTVEDWHTLSDFNIAFWSGNGDYGAFDNGGYGYGSWGNWNYGYIRNINLFIQRCEELATFEEPIKSRYLAEARFLRASQYFEMAKRMGGVPLILEPETYDFNGDATYLQHPRATEAEIYDFVISEADAIMDQLPSDVSEKSRASKGAALAMKARAALYAGSIAKYGVTTPTVSLPGGEVGIPASKADAYYTTALTAAESIINGDAGAYALYTKKPDLSENFASIFYDKNSNPEVIFVEDYLVGGGKTHGFTISNQPRFGAEEEEGGKINPALGFVQSFEKLDNTFEPLQTVDGSGNTIFYDEIGDIFEDRDARLGGTVILPGSAFKGRPVDIWAGYIMGDGTVISSGQRGDFGKLPWMSDSDPQIKIVGEDGPVDGVEFTAQTGFYIRKYQDPNAGSGRRGTQSDVWNVRYRYAEVLLNAAEAAFELGNNDKAAGYMNQVRERAGLTIPLTAGEITFDRIAHERYVELAFEGLHFYDMKRWRIAHIVLDGVPVSIEGVSQDLGKATKRETRPLAIWPYKYSNPGNANDGKWIYKVKELSRVTGADRFLMGNYYSEISQDIINNNPQIVRQPNQ